MNLTPSGHKIAAIVSTQLKRILQMKDTRSSEQRFIDANCTFHPVLVTKRREKLTTAASIRLGDTIWRQSSTVQAYIRDYHDRHPNKVSSRDDAATMTDECNIIPESLHEIRDDKHNKVALAIDEILVCEVVDNGDAPSDTIETLRYSKEHVQVPGDDGSPAETIIVNIPEDNSNCQEIEVLIQPLNDTSKQYSEFAASVENLVVNKEDRSPNYTKSSSVVKSLALYFKQLTESEDKLSTSLNVTAFGDTAIHQELYSTPSQKSSSSGGKSSEFSTESDIISEFGDWRTTGDEIKISSRKSKEGDGNLSKPASYDKSLLFLKRARENREEVNRINKSLEMRHYVSKPAESNKIPSKSKRHEDLDFLADNNFQFATDIRNNLKSFSPGVKSYRDRPERSPTHNLCLQEIEPILRYNSDMPSTDASTVLWVHSFRTATPIKSLARSTRSMKSTNSDKANDTYMRSKLKRSTAPASTRDKNIHTQNDIFPHTNSYTFSEACNDESSPIPPNSSFYVDEALYQDNLDRLNFTDLSIDSKLDDNIDTIDTTTDTNVIIQNTDSTVCTTAENGRKKSNYLSMKNIATGATSEKSMKSEKSMSSEKSVGVRKSHQKLLDKYQSILEIDLIAFKGNVETFKSRVVLKP